MLSPLFSVTDKLIKKVANQYISGIKIDSLPLWKGEATIDDINLNAEGLNAVFTESNLPVRVANISTTRLSVKIPVFSPGTNPILVKLHSVDLQLAINTEEEQPAASSEPEPQQSEPQNTGFVAKLTSNILIQVDGVALQLSILGLNIQLVISDFEVHILPEATIIKGKKVRGRAGNGKLALTLLVSELVISIGNKGRTDVKISELEAKVSDSNGDSNTYFHLISPPISADVVIDQNSIIVDSDSTINISVPLDILPSVLELISSFPQSPPTEKEPAVLPDLNIKTGSINVTVKVAQSITAALSIGKIAIRNKKFEIGPISLDLKMINTMHSIIDDFLITGGLCQQGKTINVTVDSDMLRLSVPAQKDVIDLLTSIKIPAVEQQAPAEASPVVAVPKKHAFVESCSTFAELPNLKLTSRVLEFCFDEPIIPTAFHFDPSVLHAKLKFQLRVWEPAYQSFVALVSFECSDFLTEFEMMKEHMIPGQRYQIIFPQPISSFPGFLDGSVIHYQTSGSLSELVSIKANIGSILLSLESYDLPIAAVSISSIKANAVLGPMGAARVSASLGISALLSTLRNSTMVTILDIPSIAVQLANFPDFSEFMDLKKWPESLIPCSLQESYVACSTSASVKIPAIVLNVVPSVIFDFIRYISTFSIESVVSHRVMNNCDVPFFYQVSNDNELVTINPGECKNIVFKPGQVHYIAFPSQGCKVVFNENNCYKLSDSTYVSVETVSPFEFKATILASTQFINNLLAPLELSLESEESSFTLVTEEQNKLATSSFIHKKQFKASMKLKGITDWSDTVELGANIKPVKMECEVIEMLPQSYLCAPVFNCWISTEMKDIRCSDDQLIQVVRFSFDPVLTIVNSLEKHLVTASGTIPPQSQRLIASLPSESFVFEQQAFPVSFPLAKFSKAGVADDIPVTVASSPKTNSITISTRFEVKNETSVAIYVKFYLCSDIRVEPGQTVPLHNERDSDYIVIGIEDKDKQKSWSPPIQGPAVKDTTIKTSKGNVMLYVKLTKEKAVIYPKITAINESHVPVWLKPATKIEPNSQCQMIEWRGKSQQAAFGLSKEVFSEQISLSENVLWKRMFVMNDIGQSLHYLTYSVQSNVDPHAIVFHHDPSPPFTIVNSSPATYEIHYTTTTLMLPKNGSLLLPAVPDVFKIGRVGSIPFTVSLKYATELILNEHDSPIYVKIEKRVNQVRVTVSHEKDQIVSLRQRISLSLFLSDLKVYMYDDFSEPGIAKHALTLTLAPLSVNMLTIAGDSTTFKVVLDILQIDFMGHFERFPVMIRKINSDRTLLQVSGKIMGTFDQGLIVDDLHVDLQPFEICVEESHLRFILQLVSLIAVPQKEPETPATEEESTALHPIYIRAMAISETMINLSLATKSFVNADFSNVPLNLSRLTITNSEQFNVALIQSVAGHYISDAIAAVPTLLASFSLIGSPVNIVSRSLAGLKDFYTSAFDANESMIRGIGRGSMNIVRGITMGTLESFVGLANSLERNISKLKPFQSEGEDPKIGSELVKAVKGVVELPIQGFREEDGLKGLIKGAGRGFLGIITVPTAALFNVMKRAGTVALKKVGGTQKESRKADSRLEKEPHQLPVLALDDDE